MKRPFFEDDALVAYWADGGSDYVLVTFADAISLADTNRFFADRPAEKLGLTCLALVAKEPNWYPAASVAAVAERVRDRLSAFATRIGYGGSMGGYAALKFSRCLGLTHALALCPQSSIDPQECGPGGTWEHHFRSEMAGHGIQPGDVCGTAIVCYDHHHDEDRQHAERIAAAYPETHLLVVPHVGHHVTRTFAGTDNLHRLLEPLRRDDLPGIQSAVSSFRRQDGYRRNGVLYKAADRYPQLSARIAGNARAPLSCGISSPYATHVRILNNLLQQGHLEDAEILLRQIQDANGEDPGAAARATALWERWVKAPARAAAMSGIGTHFRTRAAFDLVDGRLVHVPADRLEDARHLVPLLLMRLDDSAGMLIVKDRHSRSYLSIDGNGTAAPASCPGARSIIQLSPAEAGGDARGWAIGREGRFLCANGHGPVTFDRTSVDLWEIFTLEAAA